MVVSVPARRGGSLAAATLAFVCIAPAAYATGLPQHASDTAVAVLSKLGVVPGSHAAGGGAGSQGHGAEVSMLARSTDLTGAAKGAAVSSLASGGSSHTGAGSADATPSGQGKGAQISTLAKTTTATGVDKGAAISTLASGGKSQAGQHGSPSLHTGTSQVGGTSRADAASGGASSAGTHTANQHSGGHSSAGSGNSRR